MLKMLRYCCCFGKRKMPKSAQQPTNLLPLPLDHFSFDPKCPDGKPLSKTNSFAQDFYDFHDRADEGGLLDYAHKPYEALKVARARHRMEYLTHLQLAVLIQELGAEMQWVGEGDASPVDKVLAWRKERGDFDDDGDEEEEDQEGFAGDEVPQLTSDMGGVSESILRLCFLKSDLQFECLLRNIPYACSDGKIQLICKLMEYKDTLFLKLEEECN